MSGKQVSEVPGRAEAQARLSVPGRQDCTVSPHHASLCRGTLSWIWAPMWPFDWIPLFRVQPPHLSTAASGGGPTQLCRGPGKEPLPPSLSPSRPRLLTRGPTKARRPASVPGGAVGRPAHLGRLPRGGLRGWGRGRTAMTRFAGTRSAGCLQNSRANALAAGGRLLLSPNSSTQSIINTSPKAQRHHYGGSASHSGRHLLSRLQKLGK